MSEALIALHYQNDICHPEGRIPFSLNRGTEAASSFFAASAEALKRARSDGWTIAHVRIAFASDYSDLPRNCRLFLAVEERGALKLGSWGAEAFAGFESAKGEATIIHKSNSAFHTTGLLARLRRRRVERLTTMGLATQLSVEHTVRDAVDLGFSVRVLSKCCASADREAHHASLRTLAMLADII